MVEALHKLFADEMQIDSTLASFCVERRFW